MDTMEKIKKVFLNYDIAIDDDVFSKETIIQNYVRFLYETIEKENHNVGIMFNTNLECYDAIILVFLAIYNIVTTENSNTDIINSLNEGDKIKYKNKLAIFHKVLSSQEIESKKFDPNEKYLEIKSKDSITYLPEKAWRLIEPYYGNAKGMDGRGIRKDKKIREDFFCEVLGYILKDIPSVIDKSSVIVMDRKYAERLLKRINIRFNGKKIFLLDIITATFYSEEKEYQIGENASKSEPVIQICSKFSVARKLIKNKKGNIISGVYVGNKDLVYTNYSELNEIINRKKLQYVYLNSNLKDEHILQYVKENDTYTFPATNNLLIEYSSVDKINNNELSNRLKIYNDLIIDRQNKTIVIEDGGIDDTHYKKIYEKLFAIKDNSLESDDKDVFIRKCFYLCNLFRTAVFPVSNISELVNEGKFLDTTIEERLEELNNVAMCFEGRIQENMKDIVSLLKYWYRKTSSHTGKGKWLHNFIFNNKSDSIAIVVPKGYYSDVLFEKVYSRHRNKKIKVTTPARFNYNILYDHIIVVGNIKANKNFDLFTCNCSASIITLLYPYEINKYIFNENVYISGKRLLEKHSVLPIYEITQKTNKINNEDPLDNSIDAIEKYLNETELNSIILQIKKYNKTKGKNDTYTEIVSILTFTDERKAFLSKYYKAYVLEKTQNRIIEVDSRKVLPGDTVVFTNNSNETKDIIDSKLIELLEAKKLTPEQEKCYLLSREWKEDLIDYKEKNRLTYSELIEQMRMYNKLPVQEATVRGWLDQDSHIVGPRNKESFEVIGCITGNDDLKNNPEIYHAACAVVRKIRKKLMDDLATQILKDISSCINSIENKMNMEEVTDYVEVLEVESVIHINQEMASNLANKPLEI